MPPLYYVNVTVHILAAMLWLGGMFFFGIVGAPLLRGLQPATLRQHVFQLIGERFRTIGWITIAVLLATGAGNLYYHGWLRWDGLLDDPAFWRTPAGTILGAKLVAVAAMLVVSALHDFILGPRAVRAEPGSRASVTWRRGANVLARLNALLGVVVVAAAVLLVRRA